MALGLAGVTAWIAAVWVDPPPDLVPGLDPMLRGPVEPGERDDPPSAPAESTRGQGPGLASAHADGTRPDVRDEQDPRVRAFLKAVSEKRLARERRNAALISVLVAEILDSRPAAGRIGPDAAMEALAQLGVQALAPLRAALASAPSEATARVLRCLARLGKAAAPAAGEIAAYLGAAWDDDVREAAAGALLSIGRDAASALPGVRALFLEERAPGPARATAARAMVAVAGAEASVLEAFNSVLGTPSSPLRIAALTAAEDLGKGGQPLCEVILPLLKDSDERVREHAAKTLGAVGACAEESMAALRTLFLEDTGLGRVAAGRALARLAPDGPATLRRIAEEDPQVSMRLAALSALDAGGAHVRDDLAPLLKILDDPRATDASRAAGAALLGTLDPPARAADALPSLARLAQTGAPDLRLTSMRAATHLVDDDAAVVGFLLTSLRDGNDDAKVVAASLLGRYPAQAGEIVPVLSRLLLDTEPLREAAIPTLRSLLVAAPEQRATVAAARRGANPEAAAAIAGLLDPASWPPER